MPREADSGAPTTPGTPAAASEADAAAAGFESTVAPHVAKPTSGLDSTIAPPYMRPTSDAPPSGAGTVPAASTDLPDLPIIDGSLYTVGAEIGRGGMGRVLTARDRRLRRDVVIKVLHRGAAASRFQREALITARLQHPSIVRVYESRRSANARAIARRDAARIWR